MRIKSTQNLGDIRASIRHLSLLLFTLCESFHLVFDLFQYGGGRSRHTVEIFHILGKLVRKIFFDSLDEEVQILHVILHVG